MSNAELRDRADGNLDWSRELLASHPLNGLAEAALVVELECSPGNR